MPTMAEVQTNAKVEARKRVYSALAEVKRLLADLDIVPNMRDYADLAQPSEYFADARRTYGDRVRRVAELQNEMTAEAKILQTGGILR